MDERSVRAKVLGERAVAADHREIESELVGDANRDVDPASGDQDDANPLREGSADRLAIASRNPLVAIQERAVEVKRYQIDHGTTTTLERAGLVLRRTVLPSAAGPDRVVRIGAGLVRGLTSRELSPHGKASTATIGVATPF